MLERLGRRVPARPDRWLVALVVVASLAGSASALAAWEQPQTLSAPGDWSDGVGAAVNSRGDAIVVWRRSDRGERRGGIEGSFRPAGSGAFGELRQLTPDGGSDDADIGIDENGAGVLAWQAGSGMWARQMALDGTMSEPSRLSTTFIGGPTPPIVGVDSAGNATVIWKASYQEDEYTLRTHVYLSQRAASGAWSPEQKIPYDRDAIEQYDLGVADETGDAVIGFAGRQGLVYVSIRNGPTGSFSEPVRLNSPIDYVVLPDVAVGAQGDAAIGWVEPGFNQQQRFLKVAVRPAGGVFGAPETVATIPHWSDHFPQVAVSPSGEVSVILSGAMDGEPATRVWTRSPGGAWGPQQPVNSATGEDLELDYDDAGNLYAAWRRYTEQYVGRALVTMRPAGGSFPTEATIISRTDLNVWHPALAADGDGKAVATWSLGYFPHWMDVQAAMVAPSQAGSPPAEPQGGGSAPGDSPPIESAPGNGEPDATAPAQLEPSAASVRASRRLVRARVAPGAGGRRTVFRIRFRGRAQLGRYRGRRRSYMVVLRGPQKSACIIDADRHRDRGGRGTVLAIRFDPRAFKAGRWCRGPFRGRIYYQDTYACPAPSCELPAGFKRLRRAVGRFSLRVR